MYDYGSIITKLAISNVWMNPHADKQFTIEPCRLTTAFGFKNSFTMAFETVHAPVEDVSFLAFDVGNFNPRTVGLNGRYADWRNLPDIVLEESMNISVMIGNKAVPLSCCYLQVTEKRQILLAVRLVDSLYDEFLENPLYIRFYSNIHFSFAGSTLPTKTINYGGLVGDTISVNQLINKWAEVQNLGYGFYYVNINGEYYDTLATALYGEGDYVEIVFDGSVDSVFDIAAKDITFFQSELDDVNKGIIMTPDNASLGFVSFDDVDIYVYGEVTENGITFNKGFRYNRNVRSDLTQLTWQDWAINGEKLIALIDLTDDSITLANAFLKVVRKTNIGPKERTFSTNYTKDLYLLSYSNRKQLFTATATGPVKWLASNLESSSYISWLTANSGDLTSTADVYNFYGLQKELELCNPISDDTWSMPPIMNEGGLLVFYNEDGALARVETKTTTDYSPTIWTVITDKVEAIPGTAYTLAAMEEAVDVSNDSLSDWAETRYFQLGNWGKAIEGVNYTVDDSKNVTWIGDAATATVIKRSANRFFFSQLLLQLGDIGLPVHMTVEGDNTTTGLGMDTYKVWLGDSVNGSQRLAAGIDYNINFPYIHVFNTSYVPGTLVTLTIIGMNTGKETTIETGFVKQRTISHDSNFKTHLYKNKNFFVDGRIIDEDYVAFGEGYTGTEVVNGELGAEHREGGVYAIVERDSFLDPRVLEALGATKDETDSEYEDITRQLNTMISKVPLGISVIASYHTIVSAVMRVLYQEIVDGTLVIDTTMPDVEVVGVMLTYETLVSVDAVNSGYDEEFMVMEAHAFDAPVTVTNNQYEFLVKVNRLYLGEEITMEDYFIISD